MYFASGSCTSSKQIPYSDKFTNEFVMNTTFVSPLPKSLMAFGSPDDCLRAKDEKRKTPQKFDVSAVFNNVIAARGRGDPLIKSKRNTFYYFSVF